MPKSTAHVAPGARAGELHRPDAPLTVWVVAELVFVHRTGTPRLTVMTCGANPKL
jgi:hypothetical protein